MRFFLTPCMLIEDVFCFLQTHSLHTPFHEQKNKVERQVVCSREHAFDCVFGTCMKMMTSIYYMHVTLENTDSVLKSKKVDGILHGFLDQ